MTISTQSSQVIRLGNGATTIWDFPFVGVSAADIQVTYTDANNNQTILPTSVYTLSLNSAQPGQLWGVGGVVYYPLAGPAIANGTSLTISRIVPLTQEVTISNQGSFAPQVIEQAMDLLEMQIQQVSARTGAIRGFWGAGVDYNYADIVVDGASGGNTGQFYLCATANTSSVWATDLAAGNWVLAFPAVDSVIYDSLTATGAIGFNINGNPFVLVTNGGNITMVAFNGNILMESLGTGVTAINSGAVGSIDNIAIGPSTPSTGTFTDLTATGVVTLAGTTTNDDAPTGDIGEYLESVVLTGAAVSLSTGTAKNVTSLLLQPGDYDVVGFIQYKGNAATTVTNFSSSISTTTNTQDSAPDRYFGAGYHGFTLFNDNSIITAPVGPVRIKVAVPTTYYLVASATFAVNTASAYGAITARRRR